MYPVSCIDAHKPLKAQRFLFGSSVENFKVLFEEKSSIIITGLKM